MLDVRNIAFTYRNKPVLRNVSFVVSPGETVSLVGENGVGKTTLLKILATVLVPDDGQVLMDGQDALANTLRYRRQLGYLPESPALYEDMTVKGYLNYRAILKGEVPKRIRRRISDAIEICRLGDISRSRIASLSLGQKRRVALADAILLRPRVLLLDDFLSGLDTTMRDAAGEILSSVAAFSSVIVTGHDIPDLARWTTRFLVLCEGRIASVISAAGIDPVDLTQRVGLALRGGEA